MKPFKESLSELDTISNILIICVTQNESKIVMNHDIMEFLFKIRKIVLIILII